MGIEDIYRLLLGIVPTSVEWIHFNRNVVNVKFISQNPESTSNTRIRREFILKVCNQIMATGRVCIPHATV